MSKYKNFVGMDNTYVPAASMDRDTIFVPKPNGVSPFAPCVGGSNWAKGFASFLGEGSNASADENFAPMLKLADVYVPVQPSPPINMNAYDSHFSFNGKNAVGSGVQTAQIGLAPAVNQAPIAITAPQGAFAPAYGNPMDWSQVVTMPPPTATMPIRPVVAASYPVATTPEGAAASAAPDGIPSNLNAAAKPVNLLPIIIGLGIAGFFYFKNK